MKTEYPRYKSGELDLIEKEIKGKDRIALDEYLKKCSISASDEKVGKIKKLLVQFYDVTELPLTKQTKESVDSYLVVLNKSDKSHWTKDELKIYIRKFLLEYYKDYGMVENFKSTGRKGLNPHKITENALLTEDELERMLRSSTSFKESAYLLVAFQTGARPQELLDLKWKDIRFDEKFADITLYSSKTKVARTFPVVEKTMKALWDWKQHYRYPNLNSNDFVFPSRTRNKRMTTAGVNKMLRRLAKKAGIEKDVWGYLLRHTKATRLYEELPQQIVEKLMGHKNMAGIYAHISSRKAREELLNKVYKIEELTPEEKEELKIIKRELEEIRLENKLKNKKIEKMSEDIANLNQNLKKILLAK